MLDFLIVYLVIISMSMATVFLLLLAGFRLFIVFQHKLPIKTALWIVFIPFSIGFLLNGKVSHAAKKIYLKILNIGFILSVLMLGYLLASAR